jgi:hypothetical protein
MTDILEDKKEIIKNNLEVGKLIKAKMYNNLLKKAQSGQILFKKELETFNELDRELRAIYTPEEIAAQASDKEAPEKSTSPGPEGSPQDPSQSPAQPETLENLLAVVKYLQEKGYKIRKSAIYNHKAAGKIRSNNGKYLLKDVEKYAQTYLQSGVKAPPRDNLQEQKLQEEIRKARGQADHWEKRNRDIDAEVDARVGRKCAEKFILFKTTMLNFFRSDTPKLCAIFAGDPTHIPEALTHLLEGLESALAPLAEAAEFVVTIPEHAEIEIKNVANENR